MRHKDFCELSADELVAEVEGVVGHGSVGAPEWRVLMMDAVSFLMRKF